MKKLTTNTLLLTTALFTGSAMANECSVNLQRSLEVSPNKIRIFDDKHQSMEIVDQQYLYINGDKLDLDSKQQAFVESYAESINEQAPKVVGIATDAVEMATFAVDKVFSELLGEDSNGHQNILEAMEKLQVSISEKLTDGDTITLYKDGNGSNSYLDDQFDEDLSQAIEEAVQQSMGSLLISVGKQMLLSGGDMEAFEQRMENFGERIENLMENKAEEIEHSAEALCQQLEQVEMLENQLHQAVPETKAFDLLNLDPSNNKA